MRLKAVTENEKSIEPEKLFSNALKEKLTHYLTELSTTETRPKCFIAYAWGDEEIADRLAKCLSICHVQFDEQENYKGKKIIYFERKLSEANFILIIGTKKYLNQYLKWNSKVEKKEELKAYSAEDLNAQLIYQVDCRYSEKQIPLLFDSEEESCFPHPDRFGEHFDFFQRPTDDTHKYFKELLRLIQYLYHINDYGSKMEFNKLANRNRIPMLKKRMGLSLLQK